MTMRFLMTMRTLIAMRFLMTSRFVMPMLPCAMPQVPAEARHAVDRRGRMKPRHRQAGPKAPTRQRRTTT
jgi:hypothetical protein